MLVVLCCCLLASFVSRRMHACPRRLHSVGMQHARLPVYTFKYWVYRVGYIAHENNCGEANNCRIRSQDHTLNDNENAIYLRDVCTRLGLYNASFVQPIALCTCSVVRLLYGVGTEAEASISDVLKYTETAALVSRVFTALTLSFWLCTSAPTIAVCIASSVI
jgi:hypothetical protein